MATFSMSIKLQNDEIVYSPGENVDGFVNVDVLEKDTISNVSINLLGIGVLKPTIHSTISTQANSEDIHQHPDRYETYVKDERCLYNLNDEANPDLTSDAGNHLCFPFIFLLPKSIPSSFESEGGYIRYTISAILTGINSEPINNNIHISVISFLDLNAITKSVYPQSATIDKRKIKWWCVSGTNLHATVRTHRVGYVPGEVITLNAEVFNMDTKPINTVRAHLMQIIKYRNKSSPKKLKRLVTEIARGCTLPHRSQYWIEEPLLVPALVPSYLEHCNLMDISYKIYFSISKPGMPDIVLKLPIIIGNVPLLGLIDAISDDNDQSETRLYKGGARYESCYFGPYDVKDSNDISQDRCIFSPKYIIYGS